MRRAVALRVRVWVRSNSARAVWLGIVVGVLAGSVITVAGGARRTSSASDRYTSSLGGDPDLVLYQPYGPPLVDAIDGLPGVIEVQGITFVAAWPTSEFGEDTFDANTFAGDDRLFGGRVVEGRFTDPGAPDEFTVNRAMADLLGDAVGQTFAINAFSQNQIDDAGFDIDSPASPPTEATLVGIAPSPSEFEDDAPIVVYSDGFLAANPSVGVVATIMVVRTTPGTDSGPVLEAARRLPNGGGIFPEPNAYIGADTRRAAGFSATGLWIVTAIAATGASLVTSLLITRLVGARGQDRQTLQAFGFRRQELLLEAVIEAAFIALIGIALAAVVAITASSLFPLGPIRLLEPNPGVLIDPVVIGVGSVALIGVCVVACVVTEQTAERPRSARSGQLAATAARPFWSVPIVTGLRFSLGPTSRRGSALTALTFAVIGFAGCVAAATVGLSLTRLVDEPARFGRNYDAQFGNPFVPQGNDIASLAASHPDVLDLTAATTGSISIDGTEVNVVAVEPVVGTLYPVALEGRSAADATEIGVGREVARALHVEIGDTVTATGPGGESNRVTVVGIVMTPTNAGAGVMMTYDGYSAVAPGPRRRTCSSSASSKALLLTLPNRWRE